MSKRVLTIAGFITDESAMELIVKLLKMDEQVAPVTVLINSPGGDLNAGLALYDSFMLSKSVITAVVMGEACSAAAIALQGADERLITVSSSVMVHDGQQSVQDMNMRDFERTADHIRWTRSLVYDIFGANTKQPASYWQGVSGADHYYTAEQAVDMGLVDRLIKPGENLN